VLWAVRLLVPDQKPADHEIYLFQAARVGTQLFLELSAKGGYAAGRVSQRADAFRNSIETAEQWRRSLRARSRKRDPT